MIISFDIDNVLADTINIWCKKAYEKTGIYFKKENISNHKVVGCVNLSAKTIYKIMDQVWEDWKNLPLTENNIPEVINILKNNDFKINIVTSRPKRSYTYVKKWLTTLGIFYNKFYGIGPYKSKSSIISDYLVDDAPEHIKDFVNSDRYGFIYDQPWNKNITITNAYRIKKIESILNFFNII